MTARIASLVVLGMIAGVQAADAQTPSDQPTAPVAPAAAVAKPAPSAPAASKSDKQTEKDELGRSKWWPAAPARTSRPAPPATERDELGRSKWWPASPEAPARITLADTSPEPPLLPFQKGILFLPYLGLSLPLGSNSDSYTAGHNFGALIGIHLTPRFSLSTEISVDYMSPGPLATETQTDFTLSPLFQTGTDRYVVVFGMKLGVFNITRSVGGIATSRYDEAKVTSYSNSGLVWGATFGGFVPVGPVAIGGLARVTARFLSSNCDEDTDETICSEGEDGGISPSLATFNLSAAALF